MDTLQSNVLLVRASAGMRVGDLSGDSSQDKACEKTDPLSECREYIVLAGIQRPEAKEMHRSNVLRVGLVLGILIVGIFSTAIIYASSSVRLSDGETVYEPVIEGVMAGTKSGQGISFTSRGKAINERTD